MLIKRCALINLASFFVFAFSSQSLFAQEKIPINLFLNGEEKGEVFVVVTEESDILVPSGDLKAMGIAIPGEETLIEGERYTSLRSLASREIKFELNEQELSLKITAPPNAFEETVIGLERREPKGTEYPEQNSAILNYTLDMNLDDDIESPQLSIPLEAAVRIGKYLLFSNSSYTKTKEEDDFVRLLTNVTRDERGKMRRYILGDFNAATGELGGGVTLGGFSISKNYALNPYFLRYPGIDLTGLLQTTSDVELWVDGKLVSRQRLSPGEFVFQNIPATSGVGEAILVIRDSFGTEERIVVPFYFSSTALKKGLHEYSYNIGYERENFGTESSDYGDPALLVTHRYGFTDFFTGGLRVEANKDILSSGVSGTFVIKPLGFFDAAFSYSIEDTSSKEGSAYSLGYSYSRQKYGFNLLLTARGYSEEYVNLSLGSGDDRPKTELLSSVSYGSAALGTASISYTSSDNHLTDDLEKYTAKYSRRLIAGLNFEITASQTISAGETTNEIFSTLRYQFGRATGSIGHQRTDGTDSANATLQMSPENESGIGYRFFAEKAEDAPAGYDADVSYYARAGIYSIRYRKIDDVGNWEANAAGSIAAVGGSFFFGQPIRDGFAIVKAGEIEGLDVYLGGTPYKTGSGGEALLPRLQSYDANKISVKDEEVPFGYTLTGSTRHISPCYRGGAFVKFDVEKLQAITGNIYIMEEGKEAPAEFWRLAVKVKDETAGSPLVQEGEFYLENIPPGAYDAIIKKGDRQCGFKLMVPESAEPTVSLRKIICEKVVKVEEAPEEGAPAPGTAVPAPLPSPPSVPEQSPVPEPKVNSPPEDKVETRPEPATEVAPKSAIKVVYSVQVAALLFRDSTEAVVENYREKGYHPFIVESQKGKDMYYKVLIGRFKNRKDAVRLAQKIRAGEKNGAFVVKWLDRDIR